MRRFLTSLGHAMNGIKYAIKHERNMRIHVCIGIIVVVISSLLGLSRMEWLFLLLAITLMLISELFNTAIEKTVDLAMPNQHPLAKIAKDCSSAAVLICAVFACCVAVIVWGDQIWGG
jgi:diacylglycerol kinase